MVKRFPTALRPRTEGDPRRGQSLIELAVMLPVLLLLILGTADFGHALYIANRANQISREGANLAGRGTGISSAQLDRILDTLQENAKPPLDLRQDGCVYMSVIRALDGTALRDQQQGRCAGNFRPPSRVPPALGADDQRRLFNGRVLHPGEQVVVVEVFYRYWPLTPLGRLGLPWAENGYLTLSPMATFFLIARAEGDT